MTTATEVYLASPNHVASPTADHKAQQQRDALAMDTQAPLPAPMSIPVPSKPPSPRAMDLSANVFSSDSLDILVERLQTATRSQIEETLTNHHENMILNIRALLSHTFVQPTGCRMPESPMVGLTADDLGLHDDRTALNHKVQNASNEQLEIATASASTTKTSIHHHKTKNASTETLRCTTTSTRSSSGGKALDKHDPSHEHSHGHDPFGFASELLTKVGQRLTVMQMSKEERLIDFAINGSGDVVDESDDSDENCDDKNGNAARSCGKYMRAILNHPFFELTMGLAVCTNAIFIGWEIDHMAAHPDQTPPIHVTIMAYLYTALFVIELSLRLTVDYWEFLWASSVSSLLWNYLDIFIVAASMAEVGVDIARRLGSSAADDTVDINNSAIIRLARLFRLVRLLRVARLVRFVRALRMLVFTIFCVIRSACWAMVLMATLIYVFATLFTYACASHKANNLHSNDIPDLEAYWGSIGRSMLSLYMSMFGGIDWFKVATPLSEVSFIWHACFLIYIFTVYFAILNVVTSIFCQSAFESFSEDKDSMLHTMLRHKELYRERFMELFEKIDGDCSGRIERHEFVSRMHEEGVRDFFASLDLDSTDALCLFDVFDDFEKSGIQVDEFVLGCIRLKGTARSSDIIRLLHETRQVNEHMSCVMAHFKIKESKVNVAGTLALDVFAASLPATTKLEERSNGRTLPFRKEPTDDHKENCRYD